MKLSMRIALLAVVSAVSVSASSVVEAAPAPAPSTSPSPSSPSPTPNNDKSSSSEPSTDSTEPAPLPASSTPEPTKPEPEVPSSRAPIDSPQSTQSSQSPSESPLAVPSTKEAPAFTERCDRVGPRNAISTQPFAFFARGAAISYERLLVPRVSVAAIAGYRSTAQGDYASTTIHGGAEGRVWIRPQVDIKCGMLAMSGPFAGLRMGVGHTRLVDELANDRTVGSSVQFSPTINLGWRFVLYRHVEITPSLGLGVRADLDPPSGLVSTPKGVVALNLTVGWMF